MVDATHLAQLLAHAPMTDQERDGWLKLLPHMQPQDIEELTELMEKEQQDLRALRVEYLKKVQATIDDATADEIEEHIA